MKASFQKCLCKSMLVIIASSFLMSCDKSPVDPIRLGSSPWPGYEPLYLARELNYLNENKINLFELPSADITMESFRNHSTDVATLTLDETLQLLDEGTALRILLIMDISHGGDAVLARPEIKKLSDIRGKRISIINIPLGVYMLSRLLEKAGVSRDEVEVFPMAESKQLKYYQEGKADVVITFEPVKTKLKEAGAHVIFDSSMIPNEIFDMLVSHEDTYLTRKDDLCELANSWFKSLKFMKDNRDEAALKITYRLGLSVEDYDTLLEGIIFPGKKLNYRLLGDNTPGIVEPSRYLAKIMLSEKQLKEDVSILKAVDTSFAECYK